MTIRNNPLPEYPHPLLCEIPGGNVAQNQYAGDRFDSRDDPRPRRIVDCIHFIQQDDIREFDLIDQQINDRALILWANFLAAIFQLFGRSEVPLEVDCVDHRHHGVESGDILQTEARLIAKEERFRDWHRLGNTGGLDQEVIESPLVSQAPHFPEQVIAQGAADAAIAHFDQLLLFATQLRAPLGNQAGIDIHLAHVVDDDRHTQAVPVIENVIEQGGLARSEKAGEDGDW